MGAHSPIQKKIYRYSPFAPKITCSGLFGPNHHKLIDAAIKIPAEGARHYVTAVYFKAAANRPIQRINDAIVSSLTIEISGGEPVSFNAEFVGLSWSNTPPLGVDASGIIPATSSSPLTWDMCEVIAPGLTDDSDEATSSVQSFSVNIRNNPQIVYSAAPPSAISPGSGIVDTGLTPRAIRPGMQEVTGSVGVFNYNAFNQKFNETITFKLLNPADKAEKRYTLGVVYAQPANHGSGGGIFVQNVSFTGTSNTNSDGVWLALP